MIVWDNGTWEPVGDARAGYRARQAQVSPARPQAPRRLDAGAHARPGERATGAVAAHQGARRCGAAGRRVRHRRSRARQRAVGHDDRREAAGPQPNAASAAKKASPAKSTSAKRRVKPSADSPALPAGAVKARLPATLLPQLATLVSEPPSDDGWIYEIKFDGYRVLARVDEASDDVRLFTRNGNDWSRAHAGARRGGARPRHRRGLARRRDRRQRQQGVARLQRAAERIRADSASTTSQYFVFDLPYWNGHDLRSVPLVERRALLAALLERGAEPGARPLQPGLPLDAAGAAAERVPHAPRGIDRQARRCARMCRAAAPPGSSSSARSGRSSSSAAGPIRRARARASARSCSASTTRPAICASPAASAAASTRRRFARSRGARRDCEPTRRRSSRSRATCAATGSSPSSSPKSRSASGHPTGASAIRSSMGCARTRTRARSVASRRSAGRGRREADGNASREGELREDQSRDAGARTKTKPAKGSGDATVEGIRISHPDRVVDKTTGITKLEIVNYYLEAARWILPHLVKRPVSLVRAPAGHRRPPRLPAARRRAAHPRAARARPCARPDHEPMIEVDSLTALVGAAQTNVIEFHTWNATTRDARTSRSHRLRPRSRRGRRLAPDAGRRRAVALVARRSSACRAS